MILNKKKINKIKDNLYDNENYQIIHSLLHRIFKFLNILNNRIHIL